MWCFEVNALNKYLMIFLVFLFLGCSDKQKWPVFDKPFSNAVKKSRPATIDKCEFLNGQLRIKGSCGDEGEVLLVLPTTKGDNRIIGSPKCSQGRYEVITSTFGRPPCGVAVEYGGDKSVKSRVKGADIYCP